MKNQLLRETSVSYKLLHGYTTSRQLLLSLQKAWDKYVLGTVNSLRGSSLLRLSLTQMPFY